MVRSLIHPRWRLVTDSRAILMQNRKCSRSRYLIMIMLRELKEIRAKKPSTSQKMKTNKAPQIWLLKKVLPVRAVIKIMNHK